jgi:hypothetical protein
MHPGFDLDIKFDALHQRWQLAQTAAPASQSSPRSSNIGGRNFSVSAKDSWGAKKSRRAVEPV